MLPANAPAWIDRLLTWLEPFESAFGHVAQRGAFRRYLLGVLSDSPRKSMSAMLARVSDPGSYQAFQHFITSAPWAADRLWRQLRRAVPVREGILIFDGTSFPKQGDRSVGVARQYCGALGKIANCQVATTAALWTGAQAWILGAQLYLPEAWLTPEARIRARIPSPVRFQEKWRHALTLFQQIRAAGFRLTAVLADAEFGDNSTLRAVWHRARVPYAVGISSSLSAFVGTPVFAPPPPRRGRYGRPRTRATLPPNGAPQSVATLVAAWPATAWRSVTWRNAPGARPWTAGSLVARRTRPGRDAAHEVLPRPPARDHVAPRARAPHASALGVRAQQDELGLDHFEGRSLPSWQRHVALIAVAYTFLQVERQRRPSRDLTLPRVRVILQEVLTAHLFVTRPHYLQRMLKLQQVSLRI